MLIYLRYPTTDLQLPLQTDTKRKPRLQFLDTGLVNFSTGIQGTYLSEEPIESMYNGMIAEQITGQELCALYIRTLTRQAQSLQSACIQVNIP